MNKKAFLLLDEAYRKCKRIADSCSIDMDVVIGGGAVRDLIFDLEPVPKDYDAYFYPLKEEESFDVEDFILDLRREAYFGFHKVDRVIEQDEISEIKRIKNDYTVKVCDAFVSNEDFPPFQILYKNDTTSSLEVINTFDLDICLFGYNSKGFVFGSDLDIEKVEKAIFEGGPVTLVNKGTSLSRLYKFKKRYGCSIEKAIEELQKNWELLEDWNLPEDVATKKFVGKPTESPCSVYWRVPKEEEILEDKF